MYAVLVTGAAGGLGSAVCLALLARGRKVYGLDRPGQSFPRGVCPIACDVTSEASVQAAVSALEQREERLSAIVHTAGIYDLDSLVEMDETRFRRIFEVNLFGVWRINKAFLPFLEAGSRIVITTSELAPLDPLPFTGIYAITKAALEKYAWSLRMELNLLHISVSIVRPGAIGTGLLGASTRALNRFCDSTRLYVCNAARFRDIVDRVEARNVPPEKVAGKILRALTARKPRYVYKINRNPLLLLLNLLPGHLQVWIIGKVLKP